MAKALRYHTTVLPGNRVEVEAPEMAVGQRVEVIVVEEDAVADGPRMTIEEILADLPPGTGIFQSAAEVDRYLEEERNSWDE
ncbi:MAG: hypothetical protein HYU66_01830 [Armatimonadetes bacterium]|nr:hypothetical protein [Armatimonadota bacterium]